MSGEPKVEDARMWMTICEQRFAITLADNDAARSFAERLPLSMEMAELNGNEKYSDLTQPLPAAPAKPGIIRAGDLMLYGTRTIVVFYETFRSNYSYTRLGRVENPSHLRAALGRGQVRILFSAPTAEASSP
jgi:hypothetical protein